MSIDSNKQIIRTFLAGVGDGWGETMHPDMTFWVSGDMEGCGMLDIAGLGRLYDLLHKDAAEPLKVVPTFMIGEGDMVAVEAVGYMPLKNGKVYNNHYHIVFEMQDGRIKNAREYSDTDHLRDAFDLKGEAAGPKPEAWDFRH